VSRETYRSDEPLKTLTARRWQVCAQAALDIAFHIIAELGLPGPGDNKRAFLRLAEAGVLPRTFADRFEHVGGLRNVLVHLYLDIDDDRMYDLLASGPDEFRAFARHVTQFMDGHPELTEP
jgi:uncharacterized protein YutE (UPF0331/DUF86 family)